MIRARRVSPGRADAKRTLSIALLCIFAVLNQPLSLLLHGWQEGHRSCAQASTSLRGEGGVTAASADSSRSPHDAASCPICRTASQARYSLVVALHGSAVSLESERPPLDDERRLPTRAAPTADAPRAPPSLA